MAYGITSNKTQIETIQFSIIYKLFNTIIVKFITSQSSLQRIYKVGLLFMPLLIGGEISSGSIFN